MSSIAFSFGFKDLIDILLDKLIKAVKQTGIKEVTIGGGVSANSALRQRIENEGIKRGWNTYIPELKFTTDNAAMIAITALYRFKDGHTCPLEAAPVARAASLTE